MNPEKSKRDRQLVKVIQQCLMDPAEFVQQATPITLRDYQKAPFYAILDSIKSKAGRTFVIMFPRQSGKNELQAHIEAFLLCIYMRHGAEMVKVSPTWKPQTLNAMRRLERVLESNKLTAQDFLKESGYIFRFCTSRIYFFSGQPRSNIVGATANVLLEVDEAQDVLPAKFDKDIAPMAASTNATRVFWGTAWTSRTLLARELKAARKAEKADGIRRVFVLTANDVRAEVPAYGDFVDGQVKRLGRQHPMVKTQYFSEEIDAEGGLFPPERCALMQGKHLPAAAPEEGKLYAMTLDVAGEDEAIIADPEDLSGDQELANPKRDSTSLTIFEVDLSSVDDPVIAKPTYKTVYRKEWIGVKHSTLYGEIKAIAELFEIRFLVVDATGVGAGICSFLSAALGEKVIPFDFNMSTKSSLLWDFLGIIDSGRFKEHADSSPTFWEQVSMCEFEILPGPQKRVKWGVPDGTRSPNSGELVHDDLLISAALCAVLDQQDWSISAPTFVIQATDPLLDMDEGW
jgi:hypothetical protein